MKNKWQTTKEEREIINKLPNEEIEKWAEQGDFWRIYKKVIKETTKHYNMKKKKYYKELTNKYEHPCGCITANFRTGIAFVNMCQKHQTNGGTYIGLSHPKQSYFNKINKIKNGNNKKRI